MTPLVTLDELSTYMRRDFDAVSAASAELLLDIASDSVRRAAGGQVFSLVEGDEHRIRTWASQITLPQRPVRAVSAVTLDDVAVDALGYRWDGEDVVTLLRGYWPVANGPEWGYYDRLVVVTYDHGYDEIPADVKGIVLELAARAFRTPPGVTQTSLGSFSESYMTQAATSLTADEKAKLRPYRRSQATARVG